MSPPDSSPQIPRRWTAWILFACLAIAGSAAAEPLAPWAADPIYVFYPEDECSSEWIELQVWDRKRERWKAHPGHRRVRLGTCQIEDAGRLLNELRWRCLEPANTIPPPHWVIGIDVFDEEVMQRCAVDDRVVGDDTLAFRLRTPGAGDTVAAPVLEVPVEGSVWLQGMAGDEYDVLIGIDRSASTEKEGRALLRAQVDAAHSLVEHLAPRLGKVRVGVFSYPNMPPLPGTRSGTGARPELAFSADPRALRRALDRVAARRASGFQTFDSALEYGTGILGNPLRGGGARPKARRVLVVMANAFEGRPFGAESARNPVHHAELADRLQQAHGAQIVLHLYAVGGLSERLAPEIRAVLEEGDARFHRVLGRALETGFLNGLPLPVVESVSLANKSTGGAPEKAIAQPDGQFRGSLPVQPGPNRGWAQATLSDGSTLEHEWSFRFDDSQVRERWLEEERKRMRRVRQEKRLELRGLAREQDSGASPDAAPPQNPTP